MLKFLTGLAIYGRSSTKICLLIASIIAVLLREISCIEQEKNEILQEKKVINDNVTDYSECASYDSFEPQSDPTEGEYEDKLPPEIEDDESEDSDINPNSSSSEDELIEVGENYNDEDEEEEGKEKQIKKTWI